MSDDDDKESKTEDPSARALQRAFDDGQLAIGRDAAGAAAVVGAVVALCAVGGELIGSLRDVVTECVQAVGNRGAYLAPHMVAAPIAWALTVLLATGGCALAVSLAQTRGGFWPEKAGIDLERVFTLQKLTQLFTRQFLVDLVVQAVKFTAVCAACWLALKDVFRGLLGVLDAPAATMLSTAGTLGARMVAVATGILALLAVGDWWLTRKRFLDRMRMTKNDLKREHKEDEGDPLIKSKRKQRARELARSRVATDVPTADAIVINPIHIAVAIRYQKGRDRAPRVVAKGKGMAAEIIKELAAEHDIPIVEDIPLARLLFRKVKVGREVPAETYRAVAAVLAFVYRVTGRTGGA